MKYILAMLLIGLSLACSPAKQTFYCMTVMGPVKGEGTVSSSGIVHLSDALGNTLTISLTSCMGVSPAKE